MARQRAYIRRNVTENVKQEASSQDPQVLVDPFVDKMTTVEFKDAFQVLPQSMMTQSNREVLVP